MSTTMNRRAFLGTALTFGALCAVSPADAFGVTSSQKKAEVEAVRDELNSMQSEVDSAVDSYNNAQSAYNTATAKVVKAKKQIKENQAKLDKYQDRLSTRATSMYRNGAMSYLDVLLGVSSFGDFATVWDTLNTLNEEDADLVSDTKSARTKLKAAKKELVAQQAEASSQLASARAYKSQVEQKEANLQAQYNNLSSEYRALLEEEQQAEAEAAARQARAAARRSTNNGGGGSSSSSSGGSSYSSGSSIPTHGDVVDYAESRLGCAYVWGASGPNAFDCSGLVMWCYAQVGISLPHYTESMYAMASARISVDSAQPGDVLYHPGHVGISTGGASCIEAMGSIYGVVRSCSSGRWTCALRF